MQTREIARESWIEFLDGFSRRHEGALVNVEILGRVGAQTEAHDRPLEGISSEHEGRRIAITLGPSDRPAEHVIQSPSHMRVQEDGGSDLSLQIESSDGETTLLSFGSERTGAELPSAVHEGGPMKKRVDLAFPEFGFIVATRAALGAGVGLLATSRLCRRTRLRLGIGLLSLGALTTIPAAFLLFGKRAPTRRDKIVAA
jgi:hypothetical protein